MKNKEAMLKLKPVHKYVIYTYLLFWIMVLGICGTASMVFHAPPLAMRLLSNLCAWSPTIVLLAGLKYFMPGMTVKKFYKKAFGGKIKLGILLIIPVVVVGAVLLSVLILSVCEKNSFISYWNAGGYTIPASALLSLLSGPTGEESGWRGYLRCELEKKHGFIKGSVIQGVIWAFWHTVLWFVDSDFSGAELIPYIISNVVVMTSLTIIMGAVLKRYNNLIYAILIHFCFNFTYCFLSAGIEFYIILSLVYAIIAVLICVFDASVNRNRR